MADGGDLEKTLGKVATAVDNLVNDQKAHGQRLKDAFEALEKLKAENADAATLRAKADEFRDAIRAELTALKHAQDQSTGGENSVTRTRASVRKAVTALIDRKNAVGMKHKLEVGCLMVKSLLSVPEVVTPGAFAGNAQTGVVVPLNALTVNIRALMPNISAQVTGLGGYGTGVQFTRESGTNNAAIVAPGAAKPESVVTFTPVTADYFTASHLHDIAEQTFRTAPWSVEAAVLRMSIFLAEKIDNLILNAPTFGLLAQIAAAPAAISVDPANVSGTGISILDAIITTVQACTQSLYPADTVLLNRVEIDRLRTLKDADGRFVYPVDAAPNALNILGARVIRSDAVAPGLILAGNFGLGAAVYDTDGVQVETSNSHSDNFGNNLVTLRVEEMLALAVYQPLAFARRTVTYA